MFEPRRARQTSRIENPHDVNGIAGGFPRLRSHGTPGQAGFRQKAPAALTPSLRLKFEPRRARQLCGKFIRIPRRSLVDIKPAPQAEGRSPVSLQAYFR